MTSVEIETSAADDRKYRHFRLLNGLQCLVISDPTADKASAALDVHVGQYCDTVPGIAHYLEHMLFMGTEKYPSENEYSAYLVRSTVCSILSGATVRRWLTFSSIVTDFTWRQLQRIYRLGKYKLLL